MSEIKQCRQMLKEFLNFDELELSNAEVNIKETNEIIINPNSVLKLTLESGKELNIKVKGE